MVCKKVQSLLSDYRKGRLDPQTHQFIDQHLADCPDCRKALEADETISEFLGTLESPVIRDSLAPDVMQKVNQLEEFQRRPLRQLSFSRMPPLTRWTLIGSMIILFAVVGFFVFTFKSTESQYYTAYGDAGYTWMGPQDEELKQLFESTTRDVLSSPMEGGGSLAAIVGPEQSDQNDGKVVHTFDLTVDEQDRIVTEFDIEEPEEE